jgi:cyclic lactone autoinducer peptide
MYPKNIIRGETKMKLKTFIAHSFAKLAIIAAKEASGTASWYGSFQPKEPKNLEKYVKKSRIK